MNDSAMHMRLTGSMDNGNKSATIYRRSSKSGLELVAVIVIQDQKADAEAVADAVCAALDEELAARRVN